MNLNKFRLAALVLFAAMIATNVNAQSIVYPKMHFGIRGGVTYTFASSSSSNKYDQEYKSDGIVYPTGGLALDFRIASIPLYLETGAYFVNRSAGGSVDDYTGQVPLLLSYHYYINDKTAIQPFAGGYASYGYDFVAGARFGVGINYGRLYANVGYDIDLMEREVHHNKYKCPGLFATIGYNFGGSR